MTRDDADEKPDFDALATDALRSVEKGVGYRHVHMCVRANLVGAYELGIAFRDAKIAEQAVEIERLKERNQWPELVAAERQLAEARQEIASLRDNIECLTNNKWSEIELALADKKAHELWMGLHGVTRLSDLLKARDELARLTPVVKAVAALIKDALDSHPDTADPVAHNRLLVHYMQEIERVIGAPHD